MNTTVAVIVVTYNSSQHILDTLESVKNQDWKKIELVISDDHSEDNTIDLCNNWLKANGHYFFLTRLLTNDTNTGIAANANRGLYAAKSEWVKFLGADDILEPGCISHNIEWVISHPEIRVLFSRANVYKNSFEKQNYIDTIPGNISNPKSILNPVRDAQSQYKMLLLCDRIHFTPTSFIHRETLLSIGGFAERFKSQEDYPLWLKLTHKGFRLYFMDKITVNYRQHPRAVNNTGIPYLINPNYFKSESIRKELTYPFLPMDIKLYQRFIWHASQIFRISFLNRSTTFLRILKTVLTEILNPFRYLIEIRKKLHKDLADNEFYM